MIGWLTKIWCAIVGLGDVFADSAIWILNLVIATLGALVAAAIALLPDMPQEPQPIGGEVLRWVNWLFPVAGLLLLFAGYLTAYTAARVLMAMITLFEKVGIKVK